MKDEIEDCVDGLEKDLAQFLSGDWPQYGKPRAAHARAVIHNQAAWRAWIGTRTKGRCLACGSTHVTAIDPRVLYECDGQLPFVHPGCGGALIFGTDEEGLHYNCQLPNPKEPLQYVSYSPAGFPMGERLDEIRRELEAKHPGSIAELQAAVAQVVSGQAKNGHGLTLRSFPTPAAQAHLGEAVYDLIHKELGDLPPDPQDPSALPRRFPEIHELAAVLIRGWVHELESS